MNYDLDVGLVTLTTLTTAFLEKKWNCIIIPLEDKDN